MCNNPVNLRLYNRSYDKQYLSRPSIRLLGQNLVPCGHCLGCRLDKLALWSARCNYELIKGRNSFVTFTYRDEFLPYKNKALEPTLSKVQFTNFLDNLRHYVKSFSSLPKGNRKDFSYFCCGEYGGKFGRPHYHALFFGLDFQEFENVYRKKWKFGLVKSLPVLSGGVRYVVDYFSKNNYSDSVCEKLFDEKGLERPFKLCSRGLGAELFFNHRNEIRRGEPLKIGSRVVPVPSYYRNLYSQFNDDECISRQKFRRENVEKIKKESLRLNYENVDDYLNYVRKSNELELLSKMRNHGLTVSASYSDTSKIVDSFLVESALAN